jgi:sugar diacid utilization regulator/putative methionine-R-sulfoxide reductase with GAF domain
MAVRSARVKGFLSLLERARGQELPDDEILQAAVDAVARALGTEVATLYVFDTRAGELVLAATRGLPRSAVGFVTLRLGEGVSGLAAQRRTAVAVEDVTREPAFKVIPGFDQRRYASMLCVPLLDGETLIGALNVQTVEAHRFEQRDGDDLTAVAAVLAPLVRELLQGDLSLRLRGPSVLAELDGIVAATQGAAEVCARLVERLQLLFPGARCAVGLREEGCALRLIGDDLLPAERALLDESARHGVALPQAGDGAAVALPLMAASGTLGALIIAVDPPAVAVTGAYQAEYVGMLATQAGLALDRLSARAPRDVEPSADLARFEELTRLVLDDAGLDVLLARAAELSGAQLAVVDAAGALIAGTPPESVRSSHDLRAGDTLLGRLIADATAGEQPALATVARVLALELAKWKVRFDVETRLRGDLLETLIGGDWDDERQMAARAGLAGIDLSRAYRPALLLFDAAALTRQHGALAVRAFERAVRRACGDPPRCIAFPRPEGMLLLIDAQGRQGEFERALGQALAELQRIADGIPVAAGIGPACDALKQYGPAFRQAAMAARLAMRLRADGPLDADRLGVYRLLLAIDDDRTLREFVDSVLGPVLSQDSEAYGGELVRTLEAFYAHAERLRPAAQALFIHVNTLKYRLSRIEALTGRRLENAVERLDLYVALHALRLLEPHRDSLLPHNGEAAGLSGEDEAPVSLAARVGR